MSCLHPREEWQRAYNGGPTPVPGSLFCGLCGQPVYPPIEAWPAPFAPREAGARPEHRPPPP